MWVQSSPALCLQASSAWCSQCNDWGGGAAAAAAAAAAAEVLPVPAQTLSPSLEPFHWARPKVSTDSLHPVHRPTMWHLQNVAFVGRLGQGGVLGKGPQRELWEESLLSSAPVLRCDQSLDQYEYSALGLNLHGCEPNTSFYFVCSFF